MTEKVVIHPALQVKKGKLRGLEKLAQGDTRRQQSQDPNPVVSMQE